MNIPKILDSDLHTFMELCFDGQAPILVRSAPGTGKSKLAEAYARRMNAVHADDGGYGFFELDMSKANIADFAGYLMPEKETIVDANGRTVEIMAARYTYPFFLYDKFTGKPAHMFKHGQIVFEEWGQGDPEVKRAATSMIHERRLGRWVFDKFDVIMLSNRDIDRSGVTREYDFTINRIVIVELVPTLDNLLVVGHAQGRLPVTLAYAARNEADLFNGAVPKEQGPWLTPRSLFKLDDILQSADRHGLSLDHPLVLSAAIGAVGMGAAHQYMAFVKARAEIPSVREVVANPRGCRLPEKLDVLTFLVFDLASKTDRGNIPSIAEYIGRMQSDMSVTYYNAVVQRDHTLVSTREFSDFARKNLTLMSAVALRQSNFAGRRQ